MPPILVESVCQSALDCIRAEAAGAGRIELVASIELGGISPSLGLLQAALEAVQIPIVVMVRPRAGGFFYEALELEQMRLDVREYVQFPIAGLVLGALNEDRTIAADALEPILAEAGDIPLICHRCFDVTPDPMEAIESLIALGFDRVLSSGQAKSVLEGAPMLAKLRERSAGRIEILPGGGVRAENAAEIIRLSGCDQIHLGPFDTFRDATSTNGVVDYGPHVALDPELIVGMIAALRS